MKRVVMLLNLIAIVCMGGCSTSAAKPSLEVAEDTQSHLLDNHEILGAWSGVMQMGVLKLTITLDVSDTQNGAQATIGCIEQGLKELPLDLNVDDHTVKFEVNLLNASYEGLLDETRNTITGNFKQNGAVFPLTFKKGDKITVATLHRPQQPKTPYPYIVEDVEYTSRSTGVTLSGTLTYPQTQGPFSAVILIAGSGATDRDESICGHKPFLVLADYLTKQNIAVLRVDKRGIGKSTGNYTQATSQDFADDVRAGITYLKTRVEVDPQHIGLIGHSEGGVIAPMVAATSDDVAFIVLMAGPGITGENVLYEQSDLLSRAAGSSEELIEKNRKLQTQIFSIVKNEERIEEADKQLRSAIAEHMKELSEEAIMQVLEAQIKRVNTKWFRYFLTYDPSVDLKQVKVPVLALNGELDLQVPPKTNLSAIAQALKEGRNENYDIVEFPKLNHLFQTCTSGSIEEYSKIEETIAPIVLETIGQWIVKQQSKASDRGPIKE